MFNLFVVIKNGFKIKQDPYQIGFITAAFEMVYVAPYDEGLKQR